MNIKIVNKLALILLLLSFYLILLLIGCGLNTVISEEDVSKWNLEYEDFDKKSTILMEKDIPKSWETDFISFRKKIANSISSDTIIPTNDYKNYITILDSILLDGLPDDSFIETSSSSIVIGRRCGSRDTSNPNKDRRRANRIAIPEEPISIPLAIHIISNDKGDGIINTSIIEEQVKILNEDFVKSVFTFSIESIDTTINNNWYYLVDKNNSFYEQEIVDHLQDDSGNVCNVYINGLEGIINEKGEFVPGILGYASFPWDIHNNGFDGVLIHNGTLHNGSYSNYNLGKTLTHEMGHFLGLYHTFHKGCHVGDDVQDTPPQDIPTDGCPNSKDTCLEDEMKDMITNYMDYSYDSCMKEFTKGQRDRMNWATRKYRRGFMPNEFAVK